ncbi:MAG: SGNH/GDSL hydrolase family protein [Gammaproteobacteria bacterium]|nr:SGNH/GDSL hydrolase family protein [Gammaproteobacteria bacterium]
MATLALGPLLYLQGKAVRRSVPRLPEPPGPRAGSSGSGPLLRLLVLGDSAAAGVGAAHQDEALSGRLVAALGAEFTVAWTLFARTGATTASTLRNLDKLADGPFDVAITSLGVNDVTSGIATGAWLEQQAELRRRLRERHGVYHALICGLPPMHGFPALPQPLRWYLGARATAFDRALAADLALREDASFLDLRFTEDLSQMASDGFHPGPGVYREWGRRAARAISALVARRAPTRE